MRSLKIGRLQNYRRVDVAVAQVGDAEGDEVPINYHGQLELVDKILIVRPGAPDKYWHQSVNIIGILVRYLRYSFVGKYVGI